MSKYAQELTGLIRDVAQDSAGSDDDQQWTRVRELGLAGIGIPEAAGGSGGELEDLIVVVRELARAGIGVPIVEASTAAYALGVPEHGFDTTVLAPATDISTPVITADFAAVPFGARAGHLLICATGGATVVDLAQANATVQATTDVAGLPSARIRVEAAAHQLLPPEPGLDALRERLALGRSAALLGSAYGAYEKTSAYVAEREQFGAPLIKIPAVAAALAQMAVRIRTARSAFDRAVACRPEAGPVRRLGAVAGARIAAAAMATFVARTAHQLHGAVGITEEYGLYRYTTRLWAWRDADESERDWSARLGASVLDGDEVVLWDEISA